mmetsp:Transcript_13892/g.24250  ORF Transcript_13892/g.24250 Transcript_13892/m.24250 type:complete len:422 (+) Transcript_13892:62-1327(+)
MAQGKEVSQAPFILCSCLSAIFGLVNALTGAVLPDLEHQAQMDTGGIGTMFVERQVGSMLCGFMCGFVLEVVWNPHHFLVCVLLLKACVEFIVPFSNSQWLLGLDMFILQGCANAMLTLANASISWTYGKLMGMQMNVMNGVFGVGAALAPLLAGAFRVSGLHAAYGYWVVLVLDLMCIVAALMIPATPNPKLRCQAQAEKKEALLLRQSSDDSEESEAPAAVEEVQEIHLRDVILGCTSMVFAGTAEAAMTFWLYRYATLQLHLSGGLAGALNMMFFVAFTCTRFLCGALVMRTGPEVILVGSSAVALLASVSMVLPGGGTAMPCLGLVFTAVGIAGLYPNSITLLGKRSFISGRSQGIMRVAAAAGALLGSSGPGYLQKAGLFGDAAVPTMVIAPMVAEMLLLAVWLRETPLPEKPILE